MFPTRPGLRHGSTKEEAPDNLPPSAPGQRLSVMASHSAATTLRPTTTKNNSSSSSSSFSSHTTTASTTGATKLPLPLLPVLLLLASASVFPPTSALHLASADGLRVGVLAPSPPPPPPPPANSTMDYLLRALGGLDSALAFFQREFRVVNLDAVIGTRIVQASLSVLLRRLATSDLLENVPSYVTAHIRKLRDVAGDVSDLATPFIIANEPDYYNSIGPTLTENLFALDYASRDVSDDVPTWRYNRQEAMKEAQSDKCLAELYGTRTGRSCDISTECWERMTALGYNRYSLSHEVFYLEIAEMTGCREEMEWQMLFQRQGGLRDLQDTFCTNMLAEANLIADNGFPPKMQDLFMEQAALCGMLGYRQFFNSDWLVKILSWQDQDDGCYRWAGWPQQRGEDAISDLDTRPRRRRQKREEKRVSRECLCHRTAVAASALAQYVRFVLEVWLGEQLS